MEQTYSTRPADLTSFFKSLLPTKAVDPFGIFAGFRAYRMFQDLDAKTDRELAELGIERGDIARVAMDATFEK
jgi:uncharacterized protein YjiS (DUF1127 family)